jgi:hypothetical protein
MTTHELETTSVAALRHQLELLERERATASLDGLTANAHYMVDWREERDAVRSAYVGAAVTEIASLRAELDGPLNG